MDWNKCILCQKDTVTHLLDPSKNKNANVCGYSKLVENIKAFQNNDVPFPNNFLVYFNELTEGDGLLSNLKNGKAKWHKNCSLELSSSK